MLQRIDRIFVGINCTSSILDFLLLFVVHQGFHPTVICRDFILQTTRIIEIPPTNPQGILTFARSFTRRHRDVRCITRDLGTQLQFFDSKQPAKLFIPIPIFITRFLRDNVSGYQDVTTIKSLP